MLPAAFIIAFMVYFIKATTWRGMIFHGIKEKLQHWPEIIRMPLFECPICMTPWWGIALFLIGYFAGLTEFAELSIIRIIYTVFVASGINTLFVLINKIYYKYANS